MMANFYYINLSYQLGRRIMFFTIQASLQEFIISQIQFAVKLKHFTVN